jgi:thiol-disulfide isomerase/thioredoxin
MIRQLISILFFLGGLATVNAQNIRMEFPYFAGKTYDFIIFQGGDQKTVFQGTIPSDGIFTLTIPKEYASYIGMGRWLITGTKEGGGLDMVIPGKNFSVSCTEKQPNENNIIYKGNNEVKELNDFHKQQQKIFSRYDAMLQAVKSFSKTDKNYPIFEIEYQDQIKNYESFQRDIKNNLDYAPKFLNIINITKGIGTQLKDTEEERARNIAQYIVDELDWQALYTSGYWINVISSWVDIHTQVLKSPTDFVTDFAKISDKIKDQKLYTDFAGRAAYYLTQQGKDNLIGAIAPIVTASGKITKYEGSLTVYTKGGAGTHAPDLIFEEDDEEPKKTITLKSSDLAGKNHNKTLLIFYESGCGPCENLLNQMPENYKKIESEGVRVISISADEDKKVFQEKARTLLWKDTYCDYRGFQGINFKNYGVSGTPTLILIDQSGEILLRTAILEEVIDRLK